MYYYFYERTRGVILASRAGSKGLSTLESMLTGLIAGTCSILANECNTHARAGSATTLISNPIWVVQTTQAVEGMKQTPQDPSSSTQAAKVKKLSILETIQRILANDGIGAFWRGIGPALILVINPVLQYTVFEQLKNMLITRRTAKLRAAGGSAAVVGALTELDFFFLGALSKLGRYLLVNLEIPSDRAFLQSPPELPILICMLNLWVLIIPSTHTL